MPGLALAVICKNEVKNFPQLLASVEGCFDEIHVTDTGSTDGTLELLDSYRKDNPAKAPLHIHHFEWVKDFAAARNASFEPVKTDYVMWMDLDDVLGNREAFRTWRRHGMHLADYWLATYHYALGPDGKPTCSFMRERVMKTGWGFRWRYFVHEGVPPISTRGHVSIQYAQTWNVTHMRTADDLKADRSRNLKLFEGRGKLDARMTYYYGKELFENQQPLEAFQQLVSAFAEESLEIHDRVLAIQYACLAAMQLNQFERAIQIAHQGLQLCPGRAEYFCLVGDALLKKNQIADAIPFYAAAKSCLNQAKNNPVQGAIFNHADAYEYYPRHQLARVYFHLGDIEKTKAMLEEASALGPHFETAQLMAEVKKLEGAITPAPKAVLKPVAEIVITCPPQNLYEWDEVVMKERGVGGSETAAIHMARELHKATGKTVRVFNQRQSRLDLGGVVYEPVSTMASYFQQYLPQTHVAWRHNVKLTDAPTYVWSHDLAFAGIEHSQNYEAILALSEFHKEFLMALYGVPEGKILVTRNGLDVTRFENLPPVAKDQYKVIYSSSPDRGLDRVLRVMDLVHAKEPQAQLHVYYGFDNMLKMGHTQQVQDLQRMLDERKSYVHFHGNLPQARLTAEFREAAVWLYPTHFLETFCITAIEALCCGVYPVVRKHGALRDTIAHAAIDGYADILDSDCVTEVEVLAYAEAVIDAIAKKKWEKVSESPERHAWGEVANEWVTLLKIPG